SLISFSGARGVGVLGAFVHRQRARPSARWTWWARRHVGFGGAAVHGGTFRTGSAFVGSGVRTSGFHTGGHRFFHRHHRRFFAGGAFYNYPYDYPYYYDYPERPQERLNFVSARQRWRKTPKTNPSISTP